MSTKRYCVFVVPAAHKATLNEAGSIAATNVAGLI